MAARVLVAGAAGQLGRALLAAAPGGPDVPEYVGAGSAEMDITDARSVRDALHRVRPDVVINCAAYTAVDAAESDEDAARAVNAEGAGRLARHAAAAGADLIQVSTDYVFSGAGPDAGGADRGYEPDDAVAPRTAYGRTKAAGERAVRAAHPGAVVVRTAWVYTGGTDDRDFVGTMRRAAAAGRTVDVVDDQRGSPTYAVDLAAGLHDLAAQLSGRSSGGGAARGRTLHAAGGGGTTWWGVARAVFELTGADPGLVRPCGSGLLARPAPRPAYSVLSGRSWEQTGLPPLRPWRAALAAALGAPRR